MLGGKFGDEGSAFLPRFRGVFSGDSAYSVTDDNVGAALLCEGFVSSVNQCFVVFPGRGLP